MTSYASARPQVTVQSVGDEKSSDEQLKVPSVFLAPIRPDIVRSVHTSMAKNDRQAYAVNLDAGMNHSAVSWGTGRAVSRIPRIAGSGTSRAAQGAFGNMCRKGRMFAPTKTYRKWHRRINVNQRRYATVSALAASALPSLVMARGHRINEVAEVPLVVSSSVESVTKTKKALDILKSIGGYDDVQKAKESKKLRAGKGKLRGRRWVARRGPLVVYNEDHGIVKAFRNIPGVELCQVERLNLLQLAPGGHLGRFVIWTKGAFSRLDEIWGTNRALSKQKKNYKLPANIMTNSDITRIINSDEIQSKVRPAVKAVRRYRQKKNPLTNLGAMVRLNPYALTMRRSAILTSNRRAAAKAAEREARRNGAKPTPKKNAAKAKKHEATQKANYARLSADL